MSNSQLNKEIILKYIIYKKDEWGKNLGLSKIGLFGSFARDEQNSSSDIDIIADFKDGEFNYKNRNIIRKDIEEYFNKDVEMCPLKHLKRKFAENFEKIKNEIIYA
jgi:uncharacterized protein